MYIVQTGCKPEYVFWVKQKPPTRNIEVTLPFCFTLAFIAIPWPKASSYKLGTEEQTGGFNFSITGIKKKNPARQDHPYYVNKDMSQAQ